MGLGRQEKGAYTDRKLGEKEEDQEVENKREKSSLEVTSLQYFRGAWGGKKIKQSKKKPSKLKKKKEKEDLCGATAERKKKRTGRREQGEEELNKKGIKSRDAGQSRVRIADDKNKREILTMTTFNLPGKGKIEGAGGGLSLEEGKEHERIGAFLEIRARPKDNREVWGKKKSA